MAKVSSGEIEDDSDSDDKARFIVREWRNKKRSLDAKTKRVLIQEMQSGFTGDDDERAILALLLYSNYSDLKVIFAPDGIDPENLDSDFHGEEEDAIRTFYDQKFVGGREAALGGSRKLIKRRMSRRAQATPTSQRPSSARVTVQPVQQQSPEAIELQQKIQQRFGITIEAGARHWTKEDLKDLQATLERLNKKERAIVERITFIREGTKPREEPRCGLAKLNKQGMAQVQIWDECFGRPMTLPGGVKSTQERHLGKPVGQGRIQHEIGHIIDFVQNNRQIKTEFLKLIQQNRKLTQNDIIEKDESFEEAFAEAFAVFRTAPGLMRSVNPHLLNWFQSGKHIRHIPPVP